MYFFKMNFEDFRKMITAGRTRKTARTEFMVSSALSVETSEAIGRGADGVSGFYTFAYWLRNQSKWREIFGGKNV
jgi:hypothetical protein